MKIKSLVITIILLTSTIWSQAQQINAVPDYVFRNQMSVGRNAVTDTAAYFSIGPRYGATKGFMPPIVGDTATFSSGKRNGLLIFSVQKNKFLYWDSVRVQWSDMAGSSGAYIVAGDTASMLAPYLRKADTSSMLANYIRHAGYGLTKSGQSFLVDTLNIATRAWRQKGLDSLAALEVSGSGTTNRIAKFTASSTIGNSLLSDDGVELKYTGADGATVQGTTSAFLSLYGTGDNYIQFKDAAGTAGRIQYNHSSDYMSFNTASTERLRITSGGDVGISQPSLLWTATNRRLLELNGTSQSLIGLNVNSLKAGYIWQNGNDMTIATENAGYIQFGTNGSSDRMRIFSNGRVGINTTTDAGYQLDINGTLRSVNGANFATSSGQVGIGKTSPSAKSKLDVEGNIDIADGSFYYLRNAVANTGTYGIYYSNTAPKYPIRLAVNADPTNNRFFEIGWHKNDNKDSTWNPTFSVNSYNAETFINTTTDAGDYKLQVSGNIYNTGSAVLAAAGGGVAIGTTTTNGKLHVVGNGAQTVFNSGSASDARTEFQYNSVRKGAITWDANNVRLFTDAGNYLTFWPAGAEAMRLNTAGEVIIDASGTDAGDYKLQVVGNARIGTGKLDIASNTTFGLGVARSGTSEVAGQIYNSNGILYTGVESSAGGQIFSGSSAYAAVIGSGAAYPLQFAVNNATYATLNTNGRLLINTKFDNGAYPLQVAGSVYNTGQVTRGVISVQGTGAQVFVDSTTNLSPFTAFHSLSGSNISPLFSGNATWNTTGNVNGIDLYVTNTASGANSNFMQLSDGTNIFKVTKDAGVVTSAPTGGSTRKWKLGEAATVSPTSPNRTIRVEIDGVVYYLHAKTTND